MSGRNSTKIYVEDGYYHIYNRGVEKRQIFMDEQDYVIFLSYLSQYLTHKDEKDLLNSLSNPETSKFDRNKIHKSLQMNNFYQEITLLAYCLMPNHFHLFVKQKSPQSIDKFMNSLCTRYAMYFNRKHKRVGSLFQDVYKAVSVTDDGQFLQLSRYIHWQAISIQGVPLNRAHPSSYYDYLGISHTPWVHPEEILACFSSNIPSLSYAQFVADSADFELEKGLGIDSEEL